MTGHGSPGRRRATGRPIRQVGPKAPAGRPTEGLPLDGQPASRRKVPERDRTRPPRRLAELLPGMATALGLEDEFLLARAMASWQRLIEERVPAAAGATEVLEISRGTMVVAAREPIVAQEIRLRAHELLEGFRTTPGGVAVRDLRVVVRRR